MTAKFFLAIQKPLDQYLTAIYFNNFDPKTSLLADGIADVILEYLALALKVLVNWPSSLGLVALHLLTVKGYLDNSTTSFSV